MVLQPNTKQCDWHFSENTKIGRFSIAQVDPPIKNKGLHKTDNDLLAVRQQFYPLSHHPAWDFIYNFLHNMMAPQESVMLNRSALAC